MCLLQGTMVKTHYEPRSITALRAELARCDMEEADALDKMMAAGGDFWYVGYNDWRTERRLIMNEITNGTDKAYIAQALALNELARICHKANEKWWLDLSRACLNCAGRGVVNHAPDTGGITLIECPVCVGLCHPRKERNVGELLMLCVSELAEAMEGDRKSLPDDKLPHRKMFDVELVDCFIRLFDLCGAKVPELGEIFIEKMAYNAQRADHSIAGRLAEGGKKY